MVGGVRRGNLLARWRPILRPNRGCGFAQSDRLDGSYSHRRRRLAAASDGGIFTFGDAGYYGSTREVTLNKPIVTTTPNPGHDYWLTASVGLSRSMKDPGS